jgi:hypothetical protein
VSAATTLPGWTPYRSTWLERLAVIRAKKQLARGGYSIKIDGNLDPVTKSALADYLRPDSAHPLDPNLGAALQGTWITGPPQPSGLEQPLRPRPPDQVRRASSDRPWRSAGCERERSCLDPQADISSTEGRWQPVTGVERHWNAAAANNGDQTPTPRRGKVDAVPR